MQQYTYKEFGELINFCWQTVMEANDLIMQAIDNKHNNPDLAAAYYRVAGNRCSDADLLMKQAQAFVDKAQQCEEFDDIDVLWSADKRRLTQRIGHIKIYMDMYR